MNVVIIGNPAAGRGGSSSRMVELARLLGARGHAVEVLSTEGTGDAQRWARSIDTTVDLIVVAGGDGTVNEVLNGLPDPSCVPILHMAAGTANMLAGELGLPMNPHALAQVVERGVVRHADMGLVGDRRFLLLVTAGFDAAVTREVKCARGNKLGYRGYVVPVARAMFCYEPPELRVSVDGGEAITGGLIMVMNARRYGGLFVFSDTAALESGCFEVCIFRKGSLASLIRYGVAGFLRLASRLPDVQRVSGTHICIESACPCPLQVDGDYFGSTPARIRLVRSVVPLLAPVPVK